MRIDYNILWFENDDSWLKPTGKNLTNYLDDLGFRLNIDAQKDNSSVESILNKIKDNLYDVDVIFMDYKLAKEEKGDLIIQKIRKTELFTEILFYSMSTDVKRIIEESVDENNIKIGSVEGIYFSTRDYFLEKAKTVIKHSIKKVQEVNTMRGLVLAAESDLAEKMFDIIEAIKTNDKYSPIIHEYVFEICSEFIGNKQKDFDKYKAENDFYSLINDTLIFDSSKKSRVIQKIVKEFNKNNDNKLSEFNNFCKDYNDNILQPRNAFGHVTPTLKEGKKVLIPKRGKEIVFNDEECIRIRQQLISYSDKIDLIQSNICI